MVYIAIEAAIATFQLGEKRSLLDTYYPILSLNEKRRLWKRKKENQHECLLLLLLNSLLSCAVSAPLIFTAMLFVL